MAPAVAEQAAERQHEEQRQEEQVAAAGDEQDGGEQKSVEKEPQGDPPSGIRLREGSASAVTSTRAGSRRLTPGSAFANPRALERRDADSGWGGDRTCRWRLLTSSGLSSSSAADHPDGRGPRWAATLDVRLQAKVETLTEHIAAAGPALGRPKVDTLKDTSIHRLKEVRVNRTTRLIVAFDSQQNLIVLTGGDKSGVGNRWYPGKIQQAERLYRNHEQRLGKGGPCLLSRAIGRNERGMSR